MTLAEMLARQIADTRDWTLKLLADLSGDDWYFQPKPGLAHPLWICGHLAAAQNLLIHVRCLNKPVMDGAFMKHFPIGEPVRAAGEYDYPPLQEVQAVMAEVHEKTLAVVRSMSDAVLAESAFGGDGTTHPHYRDKAGAVSHSSRHEAFHAGQIATIRRLLNKPFLR